MVSFGESELRNGPATRMSFGASARGLELLQRELEVKRQSCEKLRHHLAATRPGSVTELRAPDVSERLGADATSKRGGGGGICARRAETVRRRKYEKWM